MSNNYRWLTELSQIFLDRDYLVNGQTVDERVDIICNSAEKILNKSGFAQQFKENIQKGWYSLSSPIWSNFGTTRGMPISCFGSNIQDNMSSILYTQAEVGMQTKGGGGTSAYFGNLRPRGAAIKDNGESSGSVHFMRLFENLIQVVSQGSTRRGNFAGYLPIEHPDIAEFLTIRSEGNPLQDIFIGVTITDAWMQSMIDGDKDKRKTWAKVLECRANMGLPYIVFIDTANKNTVDVYKDKNMKITHSNLCVTGDQRVVSDRGLLTAKELYEQGGELKLFNNKEAVNASPMQLIEKDVDVYKITLSNGMTHTVTSYHKVKCFDDNGEIDIACKDLKIGDEVVIQTNKGIFGEQNFAQRSAINSAIVRNDYFNKESMIPQWIWKATEFTLWQYIEGLFSLSGIIRITGSWQNPIELSLKHSKKDFLNEIQLILANLGISSTVHQSTNERTSCYYLFINDKNDIITFEEKTKLFSYKNIQFDQTKNKFKDKYHASVFGIEYIGKQDVYCCKVDSENHHWVCNGVVTHNCSEILLPDSEEESFVCDLSSMNILYYDEWKDTNAVELLTYFLDAVMTEFIEKAEKIDFMQRTVRFAKRHRALGIGWLGWHSYLQSRMIPWESMQAKLLNSTIAKNIYDAAYSASAKLAAEYGEPEVLVGYGRRNTTLIAIAPTKSSAFILGQVAEGIEPNKTNYYIKDLQKGKFTIKNVYLEQLLMSKGLNTPEIWDSILKYGGSVQHLECLDDNEKDVFKTFAEINPMEIIIQASARQKFIDQSQSLNLMIHPSMPIKDVNKIILEAWRLNVKSLYYQFSINAAQSFSRQLECKSCSS